MTVYVDDMQRRARVGRLTAVWSHLMADTREELDAFAARLGLRPEWIQKEGRASEHYDVTGPKRAEAIRLGAHQITYPWGVADLMGRKKAEAAAWVEGFPAGSRQRRLAERDRGTT